MPGQGEEGALPDGVDVVEGDPSRPSTIASALRGVTSVFLNPRAVGTAADELLPLARARGVRRVVVMSALNVDFELTQQPSRLRGEYKEVEAAARTSGLEWAALRSGYHANNIIGTWAAQFRANDIVRGPHPQAPGRRCTNGTWPRSPPGRDFAQWVTDHPNVFRRQAPEGTIR